MTTNQNQSTTYSSVHNQARGEVNRIKAIIRDYMTSDEKAWIKPTAKGMEDFDTILTGLILILFESLNHSKPVTASDVNTMLDMDVNRAGQVVEMFTTQKVHDVHDFTEVTKFTQPALAYFHFIATTDRLRHIDDCPEMEGIRLIMEAKLILSRHPLLILL